MEQSFRVNENLGLRVNSGRRFQRIVYDVVILFPLKPMTRLPILRKSTKAGFAIVQSTSSFLDTLKDFPYDG